MRFLSFDTLITPSIIRLLFYVCVALSCLGGIAAYGWMSSMANLTGNGPGALGLLAAILIAVVGILISRIVSGMILVVFMIRDELAWQRLNQTSVISQAAAE